MVYPIDSSAADGRQKTALDDFMCVVLEIIHRYQNRMAKDMKLLAEFRKHADTMFSHAASCFMEFAWSGSVAMNGKFCRAYTVFRDELVTFSTTACELASSSSVGSSSSSGASTSLTLGLTFSNLLEGGDKSSAASLSIGHIKDRVWQIRVYRVNPVTSA